jgi:hypothetical protein
MLTGALFGSDPARFASDGVASLGYELDATIFAADYPLLVPVSQEHG